jgi:hypothetical protein
VKSACRAVVVSYLLAALVWAVIGSYLYTFCKLPVGVKSACRAVVVTYLLAALVWAVIGSYLYTFYKLPIANLVWVVLGLLYEWLQNELYT